MNEIKIKDFSLEHTIDCGQFFLSEKIKDSYNIISADKKIILKQNKDILFYDGIGKEELEILLGLNEDINDLLIDETDTYLLEAMEKYWGLRLMKQDLWQTIIGFVCSSAASIPKIKMNLKLIVENFSSDGTFPKPGQINDLEILKACNTGYRAKYIFQINEILKENPKLLTEIQFANYQTSKKLLMEFPGIGSKVADCICLFALNHTNAFPIDTWVKQIIETWYLKRPAKNLKEIENYIQNNFTKGNIGLKQQYLFHHARLNLKNSKSD
jgi:N-glycosylase/DNA lyase